MEVSNKKVTVTFWGAGFTERNRFKCDVEEAGTPATTTISTVRGDSANKRSSTDFSNDPWVNGRLFRWLNIVDDYTRECKGQIVDFSISGLRLSPFLESWSPWPQGIVVDDDPERTSQALFW